jgi:hypothetical protein
VRFMLLFYSVVRVLDRSALRSSVSGHTSGHSDRTTLPVRFGYIPDLIHSVPLSDAFHFLPNLIYCFFDLVRSPSRFISFHCFLCGKSMFWPFMTLCHLISRLIRRMRLISGLDFYVPVQSFLSGIMNSLHTYSAS